VNQAPHDLAAQPALRGPLLASDVHRLPVRRRDARGPPRRVDRCARAVIPDSRHAPTIAALRCFRGIDTLSAAGLCAEIGDWRRFRPKQLSAFLGIVPTEHTSDAKRRQGSITKAGSVHARRLLVEAAHHYHHKPAVGDGLAHRQHAQDPRVIEISWRAQRRLHQRWEVLAAHRHKPAGVVAIACARELAAFCWEAATLN
jgi:hypothetical protein